MEFAYSSSPRNSASHSQRRLRTCRRSRAPASSARNASASGRSTNATNKRSEPSNATSANSSEELHVAAPKELKLGCVLLMSACQDRDGRPFPLLVDDASGFGRETKGLSRSLYFNLS